jgi:hypothetical protein
MDNAEKALDNEIRFEERRTYFFDLYSQEAMGQMSLG